MTLRLTVAEIPETHLLELQDELPPGETPRLAELAAEPHSALAYETRVRRQGKVVNAQGRVQAQLQIPCDRCLDTVAHEVDEAFNLLLLPDEQLDHLGPEAILSIQDLDTLYYDEGWIELGELLEEQAMLTLPLKVLCSETCGGLCGKCGVNLNHAECRCPDPDFSDSPFAALQPKPNDS